MQKRSYVVLGVLLVLVLTACGGSESDKKEEKSYTVGILDAFGIGTPVDGFKAGLTQYAPDAKITYIQPEPGMENLNGEIEEIMAGKPDVVFCVGTPVCTAMQAAAPDTPLIFAAVGDPVGAGLVKNFAHPGGNVTGVASAAADQPQEGKRLEWLVSAAPTIKRVLVPYNPDDPATTPKLASVQHAAEALKVELVLYEARTPEDLTALLAELPDDVEGVFTFSERVISVEFLQGLSEACIERKLPYAAPAIDYGALLTYNSDLAEIGGQSARLANQVLQGVSIADLPVEIPEFHLKINLVTATAIGLEIPNQVLSAASDVMYPESGS